MNELDPEIVLNPVLVSKIQNYINSPIYRETIENAAAFNSRLSADRTQRLPFLDSQTGVAQNHSTLWMDERQRLPGFREGQVYTYPSKKWRKKRRQYLNSFMQPRYPPGLPRKDYVDEPDPQTVTEIMNATTAAPSGPGMSADETKEVVLKEEETWYYDDLDIPDAGEFDEPDADSDYDYEESYNKRKKKKVPAKSTRQTSTRGRRKITYDAITDPEKPFSCDICGARYKTRPGLTYHYTHSHKDREDDDEEDTATSKREDSTARRQTQRSTNVTLPPPVLHPQHQHQMQQLQPPTLQPQQPPPHHMMSQMPMGSSPGGGIIPMTHMSHHHPPPHLVPQQQPPQLMQNMPSPSPMLQRCSPPPPIMPVISNPGPSMAVPPNFEDHMNVTKKPLDNMKPRVQPSHYCDFCLGDAVENKKSGSPEELVSCSDCGRSGHPTCLQFTANMIISVKKYRWQCIECKCCSICGTSDNDDQLLFCDDCDRGYHMYCLSPPLDAPPEGSWSCTLCLAEFHTR